MKHKRLIIAAVIIVCILLALAVAVPLLANAERLRPTVEDRLSAALGRRVSIGHLGFSWLAGGVSATDIAVADDPRFAAKPFVTAKALDVNVDLWPLLLHRQVHVNSLSLRQPYVTLIRSGNRWNISSLGGEQPSRPATNSPSAAGSSMPPLQLHKFSISDGQVTIQQAGKTQVYSDLNFTATDVALDRNVPFTLTAKLPGEGKLKLEGKAGPAATGAIDQTPLEAKVKVEHLDLAAYGGRNSDLGGTGTFDGLLRSDGRIAHMNGSTVLDKLMLAKGGVPIPHPVAVDLVTDYNLSAQTGNLTRGDVHIGKTLAAQLTGSFDARGSTPAVNMKLTSQNLPATEIQNLLQSLALALPGGASLQGGTETTTLALTGPTNALVINGPVHVQDLTVSGFSLASKIKSIAALAGISTGADTRVQLLDSKVRVAPEGIRLDEINTVIAGLGSLTGAGTISTDRRLNFHLVAHLNQAGGALGGLMQAAGVGQLKTLPFRVEGTSADPKFIPELGAMLQAEKTQTGTQPQPQQNPLGGVLNQLFKKKK